MRKDFLIAAAVAALFVTSSSNSYARPCSEVLHYYQAGLAPKAYAVGGKYCGYSTGQKAISLEDAKWNAVKFCQESGGTNCHVVYSEGGPSGVRVQGQLPRP